MAPVKFLVITASVTPLPILQLGLRFPVTYVSGDGINLDTGAPESGGVHAFGVGDPTLEGKYFPPFSCPIEPRAGLFAQPVDELWIFSRTFGARLKAELGGEPALARTRVATVEEILG